MVRADRAGDAMSSDLAQFVDVVNAHATFFDTTRPIHAARAPGRLDLMGGIADYSGALVLQWPLACATFAAAQLASDDRVVIRSLQAGRGGAGADVSLALSALPADYDAVRALFAAAPETQWAGYIAGALVVLARDRGVRFTRGVRVLVDSSVPAGKGVASSAALEVAAMQSLCAALGDSLGQPLDCRELAMLCQRVENFVIGAPCGVMDQMASACGRANHLLALRCQPAELEGHVPLPPGLSVWGIDSGVRHAVTGSSYGAVRVGAFMGLRIVETILGEHAPRYLAQIEPDEWERRLKARVPVDMTGAEFVARYGDTADSVTRVDPDQCYAVRQPTEHPVYENARVRRFRELLEREARTPSVDTRRQLGVLMYESHASYGACGLGTHATDRLVELVRAAAESDGVYGAKITGGGSGGVVAVLADADASDTVYRIAREYESESGRSASVLGGSSDGSAAFGPLRLSS